MTASLKPVSDPALLQQLNADQEPRESRVRAPSGPKLTPVADPAVLKQLNSRPSFSSRTDETGQKHVTLFSPDAMNNAIDTIRPSHDTNLGKVGNAALSAVGDTVSLVPRMGNAVAKGARDLVAGVGSFPFDLANAIGMENSVGQDIRHNLPQIDTTTPEEDIAATVGQFAVPAGGAVKGVQAGAKALDLASTLGPRLGPIATRLGQWLAAAGADLVATDPDQAATIGTATGVGPTAIQPTDTPMDKRVKVGEEAAVLGPLVDAAATGVQKVGKLAYPIIQNMTKAGRELTVGGRLKEAGVTPQTATDAAALRQGGYQPLTSDVVNTPQAQNLARGTVNSPAGAPMVSRMKENEQSIAQNFDRELAGDQTAQNAAQTEFGRQGQAVAGQGAQTVAGLTGQRATAQSALEAEQSALRNRGGTRQDASANLADLLEQEKASATRTKGGLYDQAVELGRNVQIDPTPMSAVARQIEQDISPLAQGNPDLQNILSDVQRLAPRPGEVVETGLLDAKGVPMTRPATAEPITLADLIDLRPRLSRAIDSAMGKLRGDVVERLTQLRTEVDRQINGLAAGGDPAAAALRQAETNFRENFAPRYRQGVGGKLDKAERANTPVQPTAVAERFLKPSGGTTGGAREAVEDLNRIFAGTPNQQAATAAGRNYMIGLMADTLPAGRATAQDVENFLRKYGEAVDGLGMRAEVQQMANRLRAGESRVGQIDQQIAEAQQAAEAGNKGFATSPAGKFTQDAESTIGKALDDPQQMTALIRSAQQDTTGAALKDLQNQIGDLLNMRIRNTGSQTIGGNAAVAVKPSDLSVSLAKANELLTEGSKSRAALEQLYGPEKMKALDLYRKQLELTGRMSQMRGSKASDTTINLMSAVQSGAGVTSGNLQAGMIARLIKFLDQHTINTGAKIAELQAKALTDPDLAVTLMMKYSDSTAPVVERRLRLYLENNILGQSDSKGSQPR